MQGEQVIAATREEQDDLCIDFVWMRVRNAYDAIPHGHEWRNTNAPCDPQHFWWKARRLVVFVRGKAGKARISFTQDLGFNTIQNPLGVRPWTAQSVEDTFNAAERALFEQAIANGGLIDYEDVIYGEEGFITESKISVNGGNEKTKFYVGTSFRDEDGIIKNTGYDRFSIRANVDHKISNTFDFSASSNYVRSNSSRSFTGNENEGGLSYGYTLAFTRPWINLFPDAQGNYPDNPNEK